MTMAGDMLWVIGGITTGGETLDEVLTITLGFARYNFDFVHEEEVPPEQTTTDVSVALV